MLLLDADAQDLIEAEALVRLLHAEGSGPVVRALHARIARAAQARLRDLVGTRQIEHAVDLAREQFQRRMEAGEDHL